MLHGYHLSSASAQTPLTFGSAKVFTDSIDLLLACVKPGNRTSFWGGFGSSFALQGHWQIGAHRPGEQFGTIEKNNTANATMTPKPKGHYIIVSSFSPLR